MSTHKPFNESELSIIEKYTQEGFYSDNDTSSSNSSTSRVSDCNSDDVVFGYNDLDFQNIQCENDSPSDDDNNATTTSQTSSTIPSPLISDQLVHPVQSEQLLQTSSSENNCRDVTMLNAILFESEKTKREKLMINGLAKNATSTFQYTSNKSYRVIPDILSTFIWIVDLTITNTNITCIDNLPQQLKKLTVEHNDIKHLKCEKFPETLKILKFVHNHCTSVTGFKEGLLNIDISHNDITIIECEIPSSANYFDVRNNKDLNKLPKFANHDDRIFIEIDISCTNISCIDNLPNTKILYTTHCPIQTVKRLPHDLEKWITYHSKIRYIECDFPEDLIEFDISDSYLEKCRGFNNNIHEVDMSSNLLEDIPKFPGTIGSMNIKNNKDIPEAVIQYWKNLIPQGVSFLTGNDDDEFEMARFSNHCENNYMTQQDNMDNMDNMDNHDYMMPHDIFRQHNLSQQHMLQQHNPHQHFSQHHNNSQHMMQNFMRHDQYVMPRANSPFVPNDKNPHYVDLSKKNMMRV